MVVLSASLAHVTNHFNSNYNTCATYMHLSETLSLGLNHYDLYEKINSQYFLTFCISNLSCYKIGNKNTIINLILR